MTDWDRLIEETSRIHKDNMRDAYERGYRWGAIEGYSEGHKDALEQMKGKMK